MTESDSEKYIPTEALEAGVEQEAVKETESKTVVIKAVAPGLPAEKAGLLYMDQILAVNGIQVDSGDKLVDLLKQASEQDQAVLTIRRSGKEQDMVITPVDDEGLKRKIYGIGADEVTRVLRGEGEKAKEFFRERYEYKGADGKLICRAVVDLGEVVPIPSPDPKLGAYHGLSLESFRLINDKGEEYDLVKHFNPHRVPITVDQTADQAYHNPNLQRVVTRPLKGPMEVGVLLHELRHAAQLHDKRFGDLLKLYGSEIAPDSSQLLAYSQIRDTLSKIFKAVPEAKLGLEEAYSELERLEQDKERLVAKIENLLRRSIGMSAGSGYYRFFTDYATMPPDSKSFLNPERTLQEEYDHFFESLEKGREAEKLRILGIDPTNAIQEIKSLAEELRAPIRRQQDIIKESNLREVFSLPTQIVERDAEAGSLQALRAIRKKTGINLLARIKWAKPSKAGGEDQLDLFALFRNLHLEAYLKQMEERFGRLDGGWDIKPTTDEDGNMIANYLDQVKWHTYALRATPGQMRRGGTKEKLGEMPKARQAKKETMV